MFSVVSVIRLWGFHVTITHDSLELTVQGPHPRPSPGHIPDVQGPPARFP